MNQTSFKDLAGNDWEIEPNHGTFSSILEKTKINLRSLEKFGENWVKIISDDDVAEAVIWAAIADHAEDGDIRGWQCHMSGATLAEAIDALLNSICECFPKKATFYREIADKLRDRLQVVYDEAAELISKLPNDVEELHRLAVVRVRANATEPNETSRQP